MGLIAGPERPPLSQLDLFLLLTLALALTVLIREIASAPAIFTALAMLTMFVTLGVSLAIIVRFESTAFLTLDIIS